MKEILEMGGQRIAYEWSGVPGNPVLLLSHTLGSSMALWERQLPEWENQFRISRYDHRGHGDSNSPSGDWALDDFGRDVLALLDYLEVEEVLFCGVSLGGMVGLWLAQEAPDRVARLVVANTAAHTEDPALLQRRMKLIEAEGMVSIVEDILDRWFTGEFSATHPEAVAIFRRLLTANASEDYLNASGAVCDMDLRPGLPTMEVPTLVIVGAEDRATPPAWGREIAAGIPGAECRELKAAHLSNVEAAAEFSVTAGEFLSR